MFKERIRLVKTVFSGMREVMGPKIWISPEIAIYIDEYAKAHPEKKMTKHLMRKLERQYWRSVRAEAKKNR